MGVGGLPAWIPVMLVAIRVRKVWLPIPVLLLWPLLIPLWLLAVVALAALQRAGGRTPPALWQLWCVPGALRGLYVDVRSAANAHTLRESADAGRPNFSVWVF